LNKTEALLSHIREVYGAGLIPLHRPVFNDREKSYLEECVDSSFVSSVGPLVGEFEKKMAQFTKAGHTIAVVNGTAALHLSFRVLGVEAGNEVITQALGFVATSNALTYLRAKPVFLDVDKDSLGMSPTALREWLESNVEMQNGKPVNRLTGARIGACAPIHTFGLPCRITEIVNVCNRYSIPVVEDAAESLGSYVGGVHTGLIGTIGTFSFNGNKLITTGGGGMVVTNDESLAARVRHLSTTAKIPHEYEFAHDEIGYNYRMPNINAALGCAQMEKVELMLAIKKEVADGYAALFDKYEIKSVKSREGTTANNWLNAIILDTAEDKNSLLQRSNQDEILMRPIWRLLSTLTMFEGAARDSLSNSSWLADRVVNVPSSVPDSEIYRLPNEHS